MKESWWETYQSSTLEEMKHPFRLAKDFHLSDLILWQAHEDVGYGGHKYVIQTMAKILDSWCHCVRKIISKCGSVVKCYGVTLSRYTHLDVRAIQIEVAASLTDSSLIGIN